MATVTVFIHERGSYIPEESASYGTTLGRAFHGSINALLELGKGIVIAVVALAPWLVVLAVVGLPVVVVVRRRLRVAHAGAVAIEIAPAAQQEKPTA